MPVVKMESTLPEAQNSMHPDILALLKEFDVIFTEPKELRPKRTHDHHIPLIRGAEPVNLRPYRHPCEQKNVIEEMITEKLKSGIIRDCKSPHPSPLLWLKKQMELGGFVWIIEL